MKRQNCIRNQKKTNLSPVFNINLAFPVYHALFNRQII
jgi:hypothetical protein